MKIHSFIAALSIARVEPWRRPLWFVKGFAQIFDGSVSVLTLGHFNSTASYHLTFESGWYERFENFLEERSGL